MKDTIYLYVSKHGVDRMRKNLSDYAKHEVPVKLVIEIDDEAFQPPVVEKHVRIEDWREGVDIEDVRFEHHTITGEEAAMIREKRLAKMREILEEQGYRVESHEEEVLEDVS